MTLEEGLQTIRNLVDEQAEDEGLWGIYPFGTQPIMEAYLQQELRRLHALVELVTLDLNVTPKSQPSESPETSEGKPK